MDFKSNQVVDESFKELGRLGAISGRPTSKRIKVQHSKFHPPHKVSLCDMVNPLLGGVIECDCPSEPGDLLAIF